MRKKVISVFGTRPEAIKMAPVLEELKKYKDIESRVIVTAQHRDMLDMVLKLFNIAPDYDLNIMQDRQTLSEITSKIIINLTSILEKEKPCLVLVHGDTTTTMASALSSFYQKIPVGHIEAGLRTDNFYNPFPEEINRRLCDQLSTLHFAPTKRAKDNLLKENIPLKGIFLTGNTVIDAILTTIKRSKEKNIDFFKQNNLPEELKDKKILLVTAHRRESWGDEMDDMCLGLKDLIINFPDTAIVFPVHKNPVVRESVNKILGNLDRVFLLEPMDYEPFSMAIQKSYMILTDSGGIQEEAPALGKPVLVMRKTTERPEAIEAGTVKLVGTNRREIFKIASELITNKQEYNKMSQAINPYGDGKAAFRTVKFLRYFLGLEKYPPREFCLSNS